jgi:poly-gamma-glutamate synthesis protein (capsule biosynthesis protein)
MRACTRLELFSSSRPITWVSAGDFCLPHLTEYNIQSGQIDSIFDPEVIETISGCDLSTVNIEGPFAKSGKPVKKSGPNLLTNPIAAGLLKKAGFKSAVLANNHIMDYGEQGLKQTISACQDSGMDFFGAGIRHAEAVKPLFKSAGDLKVALLAFADKDPANAGSDYAGAAVFDPIISGNAVKNAKSQADLVLINVHGGNEYCPLPSPRLKLWCRHMVDNGADAVVVHHQHVVQGFEIYRGSPIVYSVGHCLFDWRAARPRCWYEGALCKIAFSDAKFCGLEFTGIEHSVVDGNVRLKPMCDEKQQWLGERISTLNAIVADSNLLEDFWKCFCRSKRDSYFASLKTGAMSLSYDFKAAIATALKRRDIRSMFFWPCELISRLRPAAIASEHMLRLKNVFSNPGYNEVLSTLFEMQASGIEPRKDVWPQFKQLNSYCSFD